MKVYSILSLVLCLTLGCGCQSNPAPAPRPPESAAVGQGAVQPPANPPPMVQNVGGGSVENEFQVGKALLENGNHVEAMKRFAYLRDTAGSVEERDRAVIGLCMALDQAGNRGAALGVLEPLPLAPSSGLDAMKCVLAGELYLHQEKFGLARNWLSRGLEVEPLSQKSYRASALFNLGKALLAEDDLQDAYTAFMGAAEIFLFNRDEVTAKECQVIAADIKRGML